MTRLRFIAATPLNATSRVACRFLAVWLVQPAAPQLNTIFVTFEQFYLVVLIFNSQPNEYRRQFRATCIQNTPIFPGKQKIGLSNSYRPNDFDTLEARRRDYFEQLFSMRITGS